MHGLFIGLTTLDLIYLAPEPPQTNEKRVATDYTVSAGGPATNAAVAFSELNNAATLLSVIGAHPMTHLIRADLQTCGVKSVDLAPTHAYSPPVSSIIVTEATGERAVISINAAKTPAQPSQIPPGILQEVDIVLIDGHQMSVSAAIAQLAKAQAIPVVIDGGSWKPGFETVLPLADYVVCSANFQPPACDTMADVVAYLQSLDISQIAITQGDQPIRYWTRDRADSVAVPTIQAVDTLGAGDIFHGAFCHYILQTDVVNALEQAAQIAAQACQSFGTRRWKGKGRKGEGLKG